MKLLCCFLILNFATTWSNAQIYNTPNLKTKISKNINPNDYLDLDYLERNGYTKSPGSEATELIYSRAEDSPFNGIIGFEILKGEKNESFLKYFKDPANEATYKKLEFCEKLENVNAYYRINEVGEGDNKMFEIEACFFIGSETLGFFTMNEKSEGALASLNEACQIIKLE
ncbi:MAG: hypothetical protein IPN55_06355 [Saprospiraceae bacterium]|nr:hypothetical protein [Candidatus Brachybacter algidus]